MISGFRAKDGSIFEMADFVNCSCAAVIKVYRSWQNVSIENQQCDKFSAMRVIDNGGERGCRDVFGQIDVQQLNNWPSRWRKRLPTACPQQRFSFRKRCFTWASSVDTWLIHLCWLLFIFDEVWICTPIPKMMSTEWQQVALSDESCFILNRQIMLAYKAWKSKRKHSSTIAGKI